MENYLKVVLGGLLGWGGGFLLGELWAPNLGGVLSIVGTLFGVVLALARLPRNCAT